MLEAPCCSGRVVDGLSCSVLLSNTSLLVSQYSSVGRRGAFLSIFTLSISTGITLVYILGTVLGNYRLVAIL